MVEQVNILAGARLWYAYISKLDAKPGGPEHQAWSEWRSQNERNGIFAMSIGQAMLSAYVDGRENCLNEVRMTYHIN